MKTWYLKSKITNTIYEVLAPTKEIAVVNLALFLGFLPDDKLFFSIKHNFKFYLKLYGQNPSESNIVKTHNENLLLSDRGTYE